MRGARSDAETLVISVPARRVSDDKPQDDHTERDPEDPRDHITHTNLLSGFSKNQAASDDSPKRRQSGRQTAIPGPQHDRVHGHGGIVDRERRT